MPEISQQVMLKPQGIGEECVERANERTNENRASCY